MWVWLVVFAVTCLSVGLVLGLIVGGSGRAREVDDLKWALRREHEKHSRDRHPTAWSKARHR